MTSSILYFGGAGFIGSRVMSLIRKKQKRRKLIIYDNFSTGRRESIPKSIDTVIGDVKSTSSINATLLTFKPDTIVYGIGPTGLAERVNVSDEAYAKNVIGVLNLCKNIRDMEYKPKRIIFLSDALVYGHGAGIKEGSPLVVGTFFAQSFCMAEQILDFTCRVFGIELVVLRLPLVYGSQLLENNPDVVSFMINCAIDNTNFVVFGDDAVARDFVYVEEAAENIIKVIDDNSLSGVFNFGGQSISVKAIADEVLKRLESKAVYKLSHPEVFPYRALTLDYSLLNAAGIKFNVLLRDVLDQLIEEIKKKKKNVKRFELWQE
jgi:nucleoside-diphosphate-sugar epimerase